MNLNSSMDESLREEGFQWINRELLCDPVGYLDFMKLMTDAKVVISDSGGIQEKATILDIPCFTIRPNAERPVTISHGTNELIGNNKETNILKALAAMNCTSISRKTPPVWDRRAGRRIIDVLLR